MRLSTAVLLVASLLSVAVPAAAGDWPHWRGPTRDGIVDEPSGWTAGDWLSKDPAWAAAVGEGTGSPLVFRGRVYVLGWEKEGKALNGGKSETGQDVLRCLDLKTGKEEWARRYNCPSHGRFAKGEEGLYAGPHATPEIDTATGLLYALSIDGDLTCWDLNKKGERVWGVNFYATYGVKQRPKLTRIFHRDYGYTASPLVTGDWVLAEVGSTTAGSVIAFDKKTGKQAWASELKDEAGHTGGLTPMTVDKVPCLAALTQRRLAILRLGDKPGGTVGTEEWVTEGDCNIATPTVVGPSVLVTSGYNMDVIARFDVTLTGMTEAWRKKVSSKVCSPVVHDGAVYFSWHRVRCLDWKDGKQKWEGGQYNEPGSCVVTADGRLVVYGGNTGKVGLIEGAAKSSAAFKELAVKDQVFAAPAWPHVVVAAGRVLCRDRLGHLKCFTTPTVSADK
jgi:outer membrane protein assembly factor BamB